MNILGMATPVFSFLTNFRKNFDNGIILVVIFLTIPILILGMTGIADEAFAQNPGSPSDISPVYVGTTNLSNLTKESRGQSQVFDTPYLTKNPQLYDETKEHPLKMKTSKKMARIISQIPSQTPQPAAVNQISGFDGLSQNGFIPPDVQIATGPSYVVELVNVIGRIWDTNGTFELDFTLQDLFNTSDVPFDPKILYDTQSGRWFASATTFDNIVYIAVSETNDPRGNWHNYFIDFAPKGQPPRFPDQPRIGVSDDKFVISINVFHPNNGNYFGVTLFILDKSQMIAGGSVSGTQVNFDTSRFSVKPVQSLSSTSELYMVSLDDVNTDSTVTLWTITGSATSLTLPIPTLDLTIDTASDPPNANQQGTSNLLDTGDIRIQDARWFQGDLWFTLANACTPSGDTVTRSCVHLVQIDTTSNPPNVTQDMQFGENGHHYFYPAISIDQFGGLGVVFGHSSSSTFPGIAVTGQPAGSSLNTLLPRDDIKVGSGFENDNRDDDDDDDRCPVKHKYEELCDKKKPKIKITSPNKNEEVEGPTVMITGTASDDLSGIKQVLVRIDKGSYEEADFDKNTGTWKFTTGPLDPGKHKVTAKAEDKANNFKRDSVKFKVVASSDENGINIRIDSRSDDAEQKNKRVKTTSKDLDLNEEDLVGLRFNDVDIPKGSTITSAFVVFTVEDKKGDSRKSVVKIYAQDSNDAPTFSKSNNNISDRPKTTANVEWDIPKWNKRGDSGSAQTTPDISDLIQKVIDRSGWSKGNSIVIIFEEHEGGKDRDAISYDKSRKDAALLHVEFS